MYGSVWQWVSQCVPVRLTVYGCVSLWLYLSGRAFGPSASRKVNGDAATHDRCGVRGVSELLGVGEREGAADVRCSSCRLGASVAAVGGEWCWVPVDSAGAVARAGAVDVRRQGRTGGELQGSRDRAAGLGQQG